MKLLVVSDSHGNINALQSAINAQKKVSLPDAVIHLGDGISDLSYCDIPGIPVYCVRGNCDFFSFGSSVTPPLQKLVYFEGFSFLLCHGHTLGVKSSCSRAASLARSVGADVLLFGHTHRPYFETLKAETEYSSDEAEHSADEKLTAETVAEKPLYIFNPGSVGEYNGSF